MEKADLRAQATVKKLIGAAKTFARAHSKEPNIGQTFKSFTTHPVSSLNRQRFGYLATVIAEHAVERALFHKEHSPGLNHVYKVLDLGCGGGLITNAIAHLKLTVLGVDRDPNEIRLARRFAEEAKGEGAPPLFLELDLSSSSDWEQKVEAQLGGKPDLVLVAYTLFQIPNVEEVLDRLGRWCAHNTILVVNEENPQSPLFRVKNSMKTWFKKKKSEERHRTYLQWKHLLEKSGFRVSSPVGLDPLPGLNLLDPLSCWSIVFTAFRS